MPDGVNGSLPQDLADTLESSDICIIPDNDKVGKEFAIKVAKLLTESNTVKILDLTKMWENLKEKGDITDVFEMVKDDNKVLEQLEELEKATPLFEDNIKLNKPKLKGKKENLQENTEIQNYQEKILLGEKEINIDLNIPNSYKIEEGKIWKNIKTSDKEYIWVVFSQSIVLINAILENIETGEEKLELLYYKPNKKKWKVLKVDKNIINNRQNIVTLGNKGLPITSNNSSEWIAFLSKMEQINYDKIPTLQTIDRLGWIDDKTFIPYVSNDVILDADENSMSWLKGYRTNGNLKIWIETMKELRNNNIFRLVLASGFVPPLLRYIGSRTFIVNVWGASRSGKSASLYATLSAWGNPEELKVTFNSTLVGFERLVSLFSDIVLGVNEKQVSHNKELFETFIYMLNEGKSKLRGRKDGGLDKNLKWSTIAITTGEEPLVDINQHSGAKNRVLDIYGKLFENEQQAKNIYRVTKTEFGIAGPIFIEKLINEYSDSRYKRLVEEYDYIEEILDSKVSKNTISSYIQAVASIVLADSLIGRYFFNTDLESSINMGISILEQLPKEDETSDVERAYDLICSWIISNDLKFDRQEIKYNYDEQKDIRKDFEILTNRKEGDTTEKYGLYDEGYYYILPNKFIELMEKNNLSPLAVKKQLAERGCIKTQKDRNRIYYEVLKFYNGGRRRMIAFKLNNDSTLPQEEIEKLDEKKSLKFNMIGSDIDLGI